MPDGRNEVAIAHRAKAASSNMLIMQICVPSGNRIRRRGFQTGQEDKPDDPYLAHSVRQMREIINLNRRVPQV